jgi:hypothetical protein
MVIERQDLAGDNQYLLRFVTKNDQGQYILKATNPEYSDLIADDYMRTLARFKEVLDPLELVVGQEFMREEIPELFGDTFNPGKWNSGHIVLPENKIHVLLATLNKQGKYSEHRYHDYFIDENTFHWQTQNKTGPQSKWGQEIIRHKELGITLHLFVREQKLREGKAAPFRYYGPVMYEQHSGNGPMSVVFRLIS